MKKHKLLEEAMRRFPAGTIARFKSAPNVDHVSTGVFLIKEDNFKGTCVVSDKETACFYASRDARTGEQEREWAEPVKPSILDGKVAIQVNNEREFKLLMEHYEAKGWKWYGGGSPTVKSNTLHRHLSECNYSTLVMYKDRFLYNPADDDWRIIPFPEFAAEVGIDVPVFVMKSEDGVDLYEGDDSYVPQWRKEVWLPAKMFKVKGSSKEDPSVRFSTREAAEAWIEEQNKPKEITVSLRGGYTVRVEKHKATFAINNFNINASEIEQIWAAYQSLKGAQP